MRKKIFVICPTEIDYRELHREPFSSQFDIYFHQYDDADFKRMAFGRVDTSHFEPAHMYARLIETISHLKPDGIIATLDYPGALWAAIMANHFQVPGSSIQGVMLHQHKYYSRLMQRMIVPHATPDFWPVVEVSSMNEGLYPLMIKPCKSFLSVGSQKVIARDQLEAAIKNAHLPQPFLQQFDWFMQQYSQNGNEGPLVMAESMLSGAQCTLEGFLDHGASTILGVTDSIMYPGTFSFKRFEYPSRLPKSVQERMAKIASELMMGSDFNHGFFNIEFMYDSQSDAIGIIEVNPRMAYQFADLYEKVDGINSYAYLLQLSLGMSPRVQRNNGPFERAVIHVFRSYDDKRVISCPSQKDLDNLYQLYPDARYQAFVQPGMMLSDTIQDGQTFRYATVSTGYNDSIDMQEQHERMSMLLPFSFSS